MKGAAPGKGRWHLRGADLPYGSIGVVRHISCAHITPPASQGRNRAEDRRESIVSQPAWSGEDDARGSGQPVGRARAPAGSDRGMCEGGRSCNGPSTRPRSTADGLRRTGSGNRDTLSGGCRGAAHSSHSPSRIGPGCPENPDTHRSDSGIHPRRIEAVAVVKNKPVPVRLRKEFPELLQGPRSGRVCGGAEVEQASAPHLERDNDVELPQRRGHHDAELAGHECLGVIPHEGCPPLIGRGALASPARPRHGSADGVNAALRAQASRTCVPHPRPCLQTGLTLSATNDRCLVV